jgi:hypothetical protein
MGLIKWNNTMAVWTYIADSTVRCTYRVGWWRERSERRTKEWASEWATFITLKFCWVKSVWEGITSDQTFGDWERQRQTAAIKNWKMPKGSGQVHSFYTVNKIDIKRLLFNVNVYIWPGCCYMLHPFSVKVHVGSSLLDFSKIFNAVVIHLQWKDRWLVCVI